MATLKGFAKKLNSIAEKLAADQHKIEIAALNAAYVPMMQRIFGKGKDGGGFALDGELLGKYSKNYRALRIRRGLGIAKNLTLDGNLKNSVQLGTNNGKNVIGFESTDMKNIGRWQETSDVQVNRPIFGLTEFEQNEGQRVLIEGIQESLKRAIEDV